MLKRDFFREIKRNAGRFISIVFIVLLGTAFFVGIRSSEHDMKCSADAYFDEYHLMDIKVCGTLGLTEEDISDMADVDGVESVTGGYTQDVICQSDDSELVLKLVGETNGVNEISLSEGRLPENKTECVADILMKDQMGYSIGDEIVVSSGTENDILESLNQTTFTIVGFGVTPDVIDLERDTTSIGDGSVDARVMVDQFVFQSDIYTEAYVRVQGAEELPWYSDAYQEKVNQVTGKIEKLAGDACERRYQALYEENMAKLQAAGVKIEDAKEKRNELEMPQWYVLDRDKISSVAGYEADANRMGSLGNVFPVFFFLVAALVSLTAMTRMVEEQRLAAGTLKALGYSDGMIAMKYFAYAMLATLAGGIVGVIVGGKTLPRIVITSYRIMYVGMPVTLTPINWDQGILALLASVASTGIAAVAACHATLKSKPAQLMRPEAPKSGRRVFLEKIPFLWKHMNFTQKSTVRNLFRYKKRFFMTIIGIGGCMALMLVGYGVQDCITVVAKNQYKNIFKYQAMATLEGDSPEDIAEFETVVKQRDDLEEYTLIYQKTLELEAGDHRKNAFLYVPQNEEQIADFLHLGSRTTAQTYEYPKEGVALAEKTAKSLGVSTGDEIWIVDSDTNKRVTVQVVNVVENYVMHYAFLAPETYFELYGEEPDYNVMYLRYEDTSKKHEKALGKDLMKYDACLGVTFESDLSSTIEEMTQSLNIIIWVLILSAGALAFVVLYNLNSINITERKRELATLKVLGFYDGEVAMYVFRENVILTLIGIVAGFFMGTALHLFTITTVEIDTMMFGRTIRLSSYIIAALWTLVFSMCINLFMWHRLKKIDMIESLKSVE